MSRMRSRVGAIAMAAIPASPSKPRVNRLARRTRGGANTTARVNAAAAASSSSAAIFAGSSRTLRHRGRSDDDRRGNQRSDDVWRRPGRDARGKRRRQRQGERQTRDRCAVDDDVAAGQDSRSHQSNDHQDREQNWRPWCSRDGGRDPQPEQARRDTEDETRRRARRHEPPPAGGRRPAPQRSGHSAGGKSDCADGLAGSPGESCKSGADESQAERQPTAGVGQNYDRSAETRDQRRRRFDHLVTARASAAREASHSRGLPPATAVSRARGLKIDRYCSGTAMDATVRRALAIARAAGRSKSAGRDCVRISPVLAAPKTSRPMIRSGTNSATTGRTVVTVATDVNPPLAEPGGSDITFACAGLAKPTWMTPSAGPAARVSAAIVIAIRGKVSPVGRPRPAGRPVARAPATIHITHVMAPATPINPKKSPASKVDSMPTMRAPNARPGGSPIAAAIATSAAGPARSGTREKI